MPPYTVADTPDVVRRIEADLKHVVDVVRDGDPRLRSLMLTGGFARGEGAVRGGAPQNDYDLIAVRGLGRSRTPYREMVTRLEADLGLHIDLAPLPAVRLRWAPPSIFWYETALRGQVLWGEDLRDRIPAHSAADLDADEAPRLLVNRAAGLLLARDADDDERRLQASKALLAAMDVHLLAQGVFPPSQRERWAARMAMATPDEDLSWSAWAMDWKTMPDEAERRPADEAWAAAADAVLDAVPVALRHAGHRDLDAYAHQDGVRDHIHYAWRAPGGPRLVRNPTGRVRAATLRMLEQVRSGMEPDPGVFGRLADGNEPLWRLHVLREATLQ